MLQAIRNVLAALTHMGIAMNEITTIDQLDACLEGSSQKPVFIFKHSTRCPISSGANSRVREYIEAAQASSEDTPEIYLLKVVESRDVSLTLADRVGVMHQSPQILFIQNGQSIWNTSHHNITADNIQRAIQNAVA